jgi:hypothetical protein
MCVKRQSEVEGARDRAWCLARDEVGGACVLACVLAPGSTPITTLASVTAFPVLLLVTGVFSPPGDGVEAVAGVAAEVDVVGLGNVDVVIFV